jgi:hypothetical protein
MYERAQDRVSWRHRVCNLSLKLPSRPAARRHVHGPTKAELSSRVAHASFDWGLLAGLCRACHRYSIHCEFHPHYPGGINRTPVYVLVLLPRYG